MAAFSFTSNLQDSVLLIKLAGSIDEHAELPDIDLEDVTRVDIDFKDVEAINSLGVRAWINWVRNFDDSDAQLFFHQVPRCIIAQCSMVEGFLPVQGKVKTCAVPLYCEKCKKSTEITLDTTFLLKLKSPDITKELFRRSVCTEELCDLKLDFSIPKYLSVLRRG